MDDKTRLLQSEFYVAKGYIERLTFTLFQLAPKELNVYTLPILKEHHQNILEWIEKHFDSEFFENDFSVEEKDKGALYYEWVQSYIRLPFKSVDKEKRIVEFINLMYKGAQKLHEILATKGEFNLAFPHGLLLEETEEKIPLFFVEYDSLIEKKITDILTYKRHEKYLQFYHEGHRQLSQKNADKALEAFFKAKNFEDSAEIYTLIGWTYSQLGNLSMAKSFALKAIVKDENYGPPYNDFGTYLLTEGEVQESLKWFLKAKKARDYQNREFPFINAGRAYILLGKPSEAIEEFSFALTLDPTNNELHQTVMKLKNNIDRVMMTRETFISRDQLEKN